jgi:Lar family restriction alleviation protein
MEAPMTDAPELKPCPFCGGEPYTDEGTAIVFGTRTGAKFALACQNCEVSAPGTPTMALAFEEWNRRADLPLTDAQLMADPRVKAARMALESAQESIATFMGLHRYYLDSGAGDVLEEINAALAAFPAQGGEA